MTDPVRAPLTFGQLSVWRSVEHLPPDTTEANLSQVWDLPEGTDVSAVRRALDVLEARHEALRTTFVPGGERGIEQAVWPPRGVPVPVVPVGGRDAGGAASVEAIGLAARGFALDREPGWRVALATVAGLPRRLLVCVHHLVADVTALRLLQDELLAVLAGDALDDDAPTCRAMATEQRGVAGEARTHAAVDRWRRCLAGAAPGEPAPDPTTEVCWADLFSVPALEAAHRLVEHAGVSLQAVVLGAFCRAVAARDGHTQLVVGLIAGNRTDARSRRLVSSLNQLVPVRVDLEPDEGVTDLARRLQWSTLAAYRHGSFDVDALHDVRDAHGYDAAGAGFRYFFNFSDAFEQRGPEEVALGADGWTIETYATGRDNGFPVYLAATAGSVLRCRLRERSHEPRSAAAAERLAVHTRTLLLTLQDVLVHEATAPSRGGPA